MAARSKIQREKDLVETERRYIRGETQAVIAADIGVSQRTISSDIKEIMKRWRKDTAFDLDDMKNRELVKINNLEMTYWEAWQQSCEDAETLTARTTPRGAEKTKQLKGQSGNPSFLSGVQWCINKRCEILGINAPVKSEVKGVIGFRIVEDG